MAAPAAGGSPVAAADGEPQASPSQPGLAVAGRMGDPIVPAAPREVEVAERPESPQGIVAFVTRVVNGDTIEVLFENGGTETVRLVGVDAPERPGGNQSHRYEGVVDTACLDDWGTRARELAATTLEGRYVDLVPDRSPRSRGFYERLLVYLHVDGRDFNAPVGRGGLRPGLRGRGEPEEGGLPRPPGRRTGGGSRLVGLSRLTCGAGGLNCECSLGDTTAIEESSRTWCTRGPGSRSRRRGRKSGLGPCGS